MSVQCVESLFLIVFLRSTLNFFSTTVSNISFQIKYCHLTPIVTFFCKHMFIDHTIMHVVFLIQTSLFDNVGNVTVFYDICLHQRARYEFKLPCRSIPVQSKLICPRPQILQMLDLEFWPTLSIFVYHTFTCLRYAGY